MYEKNELQEIESKIRLAHADSSLRALELSLLFLNYRAPKEDRSEVAEFYINILNKRLQREEIDEEQRDNILRKYNGGLLA